MTSKTWGKFWLQGFVKSYQRMCLLKAHPQNLVCAVPSPSPGGSSGAAGGFSLSQLGRDPCFTFAALVGGQPCKERCCITPASPQHPGRLLHIPLPGTPSLPCQGTVVMWHQGSDHVCLGGSPGPYRACSIKGTL